MASQTDNAESRYDAGSTGAGQAFSIDDALMAVRWSDLVGKNGYHLTISPFDQHADEIIEIRLQSHKTAVYKMHRGVNAIVATDCIGVSSYFPTLADALQMVVSLSGKERRLMVKGKPPCMRLVALFRAIGLLLWAEKSPPWGMVQTPKHPGRNMGTPLNGARERRPSVKLG